MPALIFMLMSKDLLDSHEGEKFWTNAEGGTAKDGEEDGDDGGDDDDEDGADEAPEAKKPAAKGKAAKRKRPPPPSKFASVSFYFLQCFPISIH